MVDILIVDDHELFRRTVRSFLESKPDIRICGEAGDGFEAVEKTRHLRPSIVLMDINMPRMDGLEATRILRRDVPDCKVIIVTQNHATIAREQARSVGASGSVTKSDLMRDLLPAIENVIGRTNAEPEDGFGGDVTQGGWIRATGALGKLVHEFDWSKTPLGSIDNWPQSLKSAVRIVLTSRFAMWMSWGPDLTFLYNDAYAKMTLGQKHPWALGKPSANVWAEIWDDIGPRIRKVLESGQATWDEGLLLFLERSGYREETYHTFSYSPLFGDQGEVAGHLCVVTEETDRVIGERRLKTLRSLAAELSKAVTEDDVLECVARVLGDNQQDLPFSLTYLLSHEGKQARLGCQAGFAAHDQAAPERIDLTHANQAWPIHELIISGKDSLIVEPLGQRFNSVPSGTWDSPPTRALLLPIASQTQAAPAGVLVAGLNPYRPLDVSYAGFLSLIAGQISASIANARAYEEEKKRAEALAEIDRSKTLFFSNVSHEFRTPLTLMLGPLEDMLSESGQIAPHQRERLDIAHRNSLRLLKLVNTLLDFSRIEAGRFRASYEPTDLSQCTAELASVFRSAIEKAGLRLVVDCPSLPEPVYVDRELWEKIVFNLLSNALKFTFAGEIKVSVRKAKDAVELAVQDTGIGIPPQDLPHLFERFYRVKGAHGRTFEGSGIGLALIQELTRLHGGAVSVESQEGHGSTFHVSVPLGKAHLPADRIGASRTPVSTKRGEAYVQEALRWLPATHEPLGTSVISSSAGATDNPVVKVAAEARILLADDNADMREYVQRLLQERYEVTAVADGQAALESVRERRPDLILADVMMPRLDGFGLLRQLRSDEELNSIPVILLSARAGEESRVEGLHAGADDYLVKPFTARELTARVKTHINMAKLRHEALQAIEESERKYRDLAETASIALHWVGPDGKILWANKAELELLGYKAEEYIGHNITEFHVDGPVIDDILHRLCRGDRLLEYEARLRAKDGSFRHVVIDSSVLFENGKFIHTRCFTRDITERKHAEEALSESEERYRTVAETASDAIVSIDENSTILFANSATAQVFGYKPNEVVGKNLTMLMPDYMRHLHEAGLQRYVATGKRHLNWDATELPGLHKDGYEIPLEVSFGEHTKAGKRYFTGFARDISERKRAEQALRESEQRLRVVTDATPVMIWMSGTDKLCYYFNKSWLDFVGRTLEQEMGNGWAENVHPDDFDRCLQVYVTCFDARQPFEMEYRIRHHSGQYRWILDHGVPRYTPDGTFEGYVGGCLDIQGQKQAEEALHRNASWLAGQKEAFQTAVNGAPLEESLRALIKAAIEQTDAEARCAFYIADASGTALYHVTSIPESYANEVAGFKIGPESLACGLAVYTGQSVITPDVTKEPRWKPWLWLAEKYEYRACWSFPVEGSAGKVVGTFAMYFKQPREATGRDHEFAARLAQAAGIIISRYREAEERTHAESVLRESEERFRALVNATSYVVYRMSPDWSEMRQLEGRGFISDSGKPRTDWLEEYIHPDDQEFVLRAIREAVQTKSIFELEHRVRRVDGSLGWTYSRAVPLIDDSGEIVEWFGAASDVTARKEAEQKYRELAEMLEGQVRARTRDLEERNAEILRQSEEVRELHWRLLRAQDEERRHIARELHDSAGQTLTVLGMNLGQLVQKAGLNDRQLATDAETIQEMVQQLHRDIRTASYLLHPPLLDESGLYSALSWYIQGLIERSGLQINLEIPEDFGRLPRDMELVIFRLVQECLTNIHRHSGSKSASIRIARVTSEVTIDIQDSGHGIPPQRLTEIQSGGSGVGIRGMRERLGQFKGEMNIHSNSSGTRISVAIPLTKSSDVQEERSAQSISTT